MSKLQASDALVAVLSRRRVAIIAGLTVRQVDYWAATGLVSPATDERLPGGKRVRLYGFQQTLELLIVARLVEHPSISLQHVRRVIDYVRERGVERPLREVQWAVDGAEIYVRLDDEWIGDKRPDQTVLPNVLKIEPLRTRVAEGVQRRRDAAGSIERQGAVHGGVPVLSDTRVPVATVRKYVARGYSEQAILTAFPELERTDLSAVRADVA